MEGSLNVAVISAQLLLQEPIEHSTNIVIKPRLRNIGLANTNLSELEDIINYRFKRRIHLESALTVTAQASLLYMGSYSEPYIPDSNQKLAMLGDRILSYHTTKTAMAHFETEEQIQSHCSIVVSNKNLLKVGKAKGLAPFIRRNPGDTGPVPKNVMATTVEAIVGAADVDGGFEAAITVLDALGLRGDLPGQDEKNEARQIVRHDSARRIIDYYV